jgi:hypothetical protein
MVLDSFGEVQAESRALGDDVVVTELKAEKWDLAPGRRYLQARRPELYAKLAKPHPPGRGSVTEPGWRVDPRSPESSPPARDGCGKSSPSNRSTTTSVKATRGSARVPPL